MRALILVVLLMTGCLDLTGPTNGRVVFALDPSCQALIVAPQHFAFSIDGDLVGGATLGAGEHSAEFLIAPGTHQLAATVPDLSLFLTWEPVTTTIDRGQLVTYLMRCPAADGKQ